MRASAMRLSQLASSANLELAWRRITTGGNQQYKRIFRTLYYSYEVALDANLRDLRSRLLGGSYVAQHPDRVYIPKASGLHRPLTLLSVEDQVVLQAFANLAAARVQTRRAPLQFRVVFSNILQSADSIFFFRRWQGTYAAFQEAVAGHYTAGRRWVGDFDLAAFYDTISHELLLSTVYPRTKSDDLTWFAQCLRTWSSDAHSSGHGHGLPQGPLASDFLAECFLLPVDRAMRSCRGYIRYVDDVRLLGRSEDEVRSHLYALERVCRERGLIPQTGKFALKKAFTLRDAMGMLPSIADPHHTAGPISIKASKAKAELRPALRGRPLRVVDKTRLRYVLYRAEPDAALLKLVLKLIPRHPEHADAFFAYLGRFGYRRVIEQVARHLLDSSPYPYVHGEAWHVLARYRRDGRAMVFRSPASLTSRATKVAKLKNRDNFAARWGVCHYLCVCEEVTQGHYSRFLKYQAPLLQALVAPVLPAGAFLRGEVVEDYLLRTAPEPGLAVCGLIIERGVTPAAFGLVENQLPTQVRNTLRALGAFAGPGRNVDPIAEILQARYGLPIGKSWHQLLGAEYLHALGLLKQAEAVFVSGRSFWLVCQNSFNQTVFLALQRHFQAIGHPAACTTINKHGQLVDFGVTLDLNGPFSAQCPTIASCFRDMNTRRNHLPVTHAYAKKTAAQSMPLKAKEKERFVSRLRHAYSGFVALMP